MTDKFPRPGGGDGDGPAETPTERLLREAMNARASMVNAHDLRPAAPPKGRIRRLRPVYLTTAPILALAASLAIGVLAIHGDPVAKQDVPPPPAASITTSPSPTATPTPTDTPSPTPTPTPTDTGTPTGDAETDVPLADATPSSAPPATGSASSYTLRGVKFKVPAGWKAVPVSPDRVCVLSPGAPTDPQQNWEPARCEPYGVLVVAYNSPDDVGSGAWPTTADLASDGGWGHQPNCPIWGRPYFPANGYSSVGAPVRTKPTVAGKTIDKTQWNVGCNAGDTFTAQLWGMSSDLVFVVANGLKGDYQAGLATIVNSLDVSGHKVPSPTSTPTAATGKDIAVNIDADGLGAGQQVSTNGTPVTFTVTYRNTGQKTYEQIQPLVYTKEYSGTPPSPVLLMNAGKLERQDAGSWSQIPLSVGGGMDYAMVNKAAYFRLAPGESRKVTYRISLDPADGPGEMPLVAQAALPYPSTAPLTVLGEVSQVVRVVK
ncbi:hypothetical protein ACGF12_00390 [Kitasatospora sp. NPDC048296]|uniref:hypothetical protein n=1 Tax=Kitasatospora sp. NPDC048296 TaxID=3364048 RepID=UPI0037153F5A